MKRHRGVHTPALSQAEKLQVMVAELRLSRCIGTGRDVPSSHPPVTCHSSERSVALPPATVNEELCPGKFGELWVSFGLGLRNLFSTHSASAVCWSLHLPQGQH